MTGDTRDRLALAIQSQLESGEFADRLADLLSGAGFGDVAALTAERDALRTALGNKVAALIAFADIWQADAAKSEPDVAHALGHCARCVRALAGTTPDQERGA